MLLNIPFYLLSIFRAPCLPKWPPILVKYYKLNRRRSEYLKIRHSVCLIDQATARLKLGECLIDQAAARSNSGSYLIDQAAARSKSGAA